MGLFAQVGRPEFAGRTLKESLTSGAECGAELHPLWISGSTVDTQATPGATERGPGLRASLVRSPTVLCQRTCEPSLARGGPFEIVPVGFV